MGDREQRFVPSPALLITVRHDGAGIRRPDEEPAIPLGWAELDLLERIASGAPWTSTAALDELVSTLRSERFLLDGSPPSDPAGDASPAPSRPTPEIGDLVTTATPLVLRLGSRGFEALDHDGRLRARLTATELAAFIALAETGSRDKALERHREDAGPAALEPAAFDALVERLAAVRLVGPTDTATLGGREDQDAKRIRAHWAHMSKAAERAVAHHDRDEAARRTAGADRRIKVIPIDRGHPMPLGLGFIVAHAKSWEGGKLDAHYQFVPAWFTRPRQPLLDPEHPAVYLFSNYVWQHQRNLETSERIKEAAPHCLTIHGGPDTPKYERDVETYLRQNPHVDIAVHGEGELTTAEALDALAP